MVTVAVAVSIVHRRAIPIPWIDTLMRAAFVEQISLVKLHQHGGRDDAKRKAGVA
ncbi:hypothetical protein [Bradyrhizobium embrapense]